MTFKKEKEILSPTKKLLGKYFIRGGNRSERNGTKNTVPRNLPVPETWLVRKRSQAGTFSKTLRCKKKKEKTL